MVLKFQMRSCLSAILLCKFKTRWTTYDREILGSQLKLKEQKYSALVKVSVFWQNKVAVIYFLVQKQSTRGDRLSSHQTKLCTNVQKAIQKISNEFEAIFLVLQVGHFLNAPRILRIKIFIHPNTRIRLSTERISILHQAIIYSGR